MFLGRQLTPSPSPSPQPLRTSAASLCAFLVVAAVGPRGIVAFALAGGAGGAGVHLAALAGGGGIQGVPSPQLQTLADRAAATAVAVEARKRRQGLGGGAELDQVSTKVSADSGKVTAEISAEGPILRRGVWAPLPPSMDDSEAEEHFMPRTPAEAAAAAWTEGIAEMPDSQAEAWDRIFSARKNGPHRVAKEDFAATQAEGYIGRLQLLLGSASSVDWYFISSVMALFVVMDVTVLQQLPETIRTNFVLLIFWLLLGTAVGAEVWLRKGARDGMLWIEGYALELIFSVDRVFVTWLILTALETPRRLMGKALFIGLLGSMVIRWCFLLGLAPMLNQLQVVPYVLGVWLVYCGAQQLAAREDDEDAADVTRTPAVVALRSLLGSRLAEFYDEEGEGVLTVVKQKVCVTLLGAVLVCLFIADLVFSLDIALLKREEVPIPFVDLSSAAVAVFASRSLFFVVRDLINVFQLARYTPGLILFLLGAETLLGRVIVVNGLFSAAVCLTIVALSALLSWLQSGASLKSWV
mmetsp:Transcript_83844/g.211142  ORF Transcript_83844/g.211142 Transcript_83844/m.211142 type:complete len:525 (+) Transcript_83844:129-1703(+)